MDFHYNDADLYKRMNEYQRLINNPIISHDRLSEARQHLSQLEEYIKNKDKKVSEQYYRYGVDPVHLTLSPIEKVIAELDKLEKKYEER